MLNNYFKTAFRNLLKNQGYTAINVFGLALGLSCSIMIGLWVLDELEVDQFHEFDERLFQVMEFQEYSKGDVLTTVTTPGPLAAALVKEFPEIERGVSTTWEVERYFETNGSVFKESGIYASQDFFRLFSFGAWGFSPAEMLAEVNHIAVSESMAKRLYPDESALGQTVKVDGEYSFLITAIFPDLEGNSSMQFSYVIPFSDWLSRNAWAEVWGNNGPRTYVLLREGADPEEVSAKIGSFVKQKYEDSNVTLFLRKYSDGYLYGRYDNGNLSGGRIDYVYLFSLVAISVLLIACINFMNISTARALRRSREVAVRKALGAHRGDLIGQYLSESFLITAFALAVGMIMVELLLPIFNYVSAKSLEIPYGQPWFWLDLVGILVITGLISGSYPAFYLSGFNVIEILRGTIRGTTREHFIRQAQVVFQLVVCVVLTTATITIFHQINHVQNLNIGYGKDGLIGFWLDGKLKSERYDDFATQVLSIDGVANISRSSHQMVYRSSSTSEVSWPGKNDEELILFENFGVDEHFLETMQMELKEGRFFESGQLADTAAIVFNEAAINAMNLENPVGEEIQLWDASVEIIGVVKNFHFQDARYQVGPAFMLYRPEWASFAYVRVKPNLVKTTLNHLEKLFQQYNPGYPFEYNDMDMRYKSLYEREERIGEIAMYFSVLAILISILGLVGLSMFGAEQRKREISIRKALGASPYSLVLLLTTNTTKLVLISILISVPLTILVVSQYLSGYAFRAELSLWTLLLVYLASIVLSWLAVGWQTAKAAQTNPVEVLKYD